jgi:formate hydrogenlyase subunit 6/NADH:ubiquinone oxidoreductase subunit I
MLKRLFPTKALKWTFKTATHGTEVTRLYPEFMIELPEAERGIHELDATLCIGCASCARICPNSCIEMVPYECGNPLKNKKMVFPQVDYGRCMFCGLCVDECPVECLKMGKKVTMAGWTRQDLIKRPEELAVKKYSKEEAKKLAEEAKRLAAEKKKAAAAKAEGAAKKAAGEGATPPKKAAREGAGGANEKATKKESIAKESTAEVKSKEGGAS